MIDMAPVALEYPVNGCDSGEEGAKFKTQELEPEVSMRMLELHCLSHWQVPRVNTTPVTNKNMRERQKKPSASMEMTEAKWRVSGQDIVDDLVLCLSDKLRLEVTSELGESLEAITEEDLMEAIKRMAVLVSNPMVHRNQMRDHRQGETEKVRGFVARV